MNTKTLFGLSLLIVITGCFPTNNTEDTEPVPAIIEVSYNDVFVKIDFPEGNLSNGVRCFAPGYYPNFNFDFNNVFIEYWDWQTTELIKDSSRYRIRYYNLRHTSYLEENEALQKGLNDAKNNSIDFISCKAHLIDNNNNLIAERWDEGYNERVNIRLWERLGFECNYDPYHAAWNSEEWECSNFCLGSICESDFGYVHTERLQNLILSEAIQ